MTILFVDRKVLIVPCVKLHLGFGCHTHTASSRFVVVVISCILHRKVLCFRDGCVHVRCVCIRRDEVFYRIVVSTHIRTGIEAYTDGGFCGY